MAFCDFVVRYDPENDSKEDIADRILYSLFISRAKSNKFTTLFVGGDSGEGKSLSVISILIKMLQLQQLDIDKNFKVSNICTPLEYPEKIDKLLYDKEYKKNNIAIIHEARDVVKAKNWYSFLNQAVADVNAMSRTIKPLFMVLISQFIKDIDKSIRYTLNYYGVMKRPRGKKARLYLSIIWKDDRDLEAPRIRKRRIMGYLKYPSGRYVRFAPEYIEFSLPDKKYIDWFNEMDKAAKSESIRAKMDKLIKEIKGDMGEEVKNLDKLVTFYTEKIDRLADIGKRYKKGWKLKPNVRDMLDLSKDEAKILERKLNTKLEEMGVMGNE